MNKFLSVLVVVCLFTSAPVAAEEKMDAASGTVQKTTFAGGCFWCLESDMEKLEGIVSAVSGYMGGSGENPTYQDYAQRGFIEVVEVEFDSNRISYQDLLSYFWRHVDPLDSGGQFCDRGYAYTTAIFYHDEFQRKTAEDSKQKLEQSKKLSAPIMTPIASASIFYPAEEYHQDYYKKNPLKYKYYRFNCGRDQRIKKVWGGK
jgi:methionine-S-sulfoxide reductase